MKKHMTTSIVLTALACAAPVAAQDAGGAGAGAAGRRSRAHRRPRPSRCNMADMRHHIYVMEGALARAVDYGAKQLNREILAVMPGVFMLEGEARARGVHLDGYGVFFDVRVPMMRQSMVWSLRMMLDQDDAANAGGDQRAAQVDAGRHRSDHPRVDRERACASSNGRRPATPRNPAGGARRWSMLGAVVARPVGAATATGLRRPAPRRRRRRRQRLGEGSEPRLHRGRDRARSSTR